MIYWGRTNIKFNNRSFDEFEVSSGVAKEEIYEKLITQAYLSMQFVWLILIPDKSTSIIHDILLLI